MRQHRCLTFAGHLTALLLLMVHRHFLCPTMVTQALIARQHGFISTPALIQLPKQQRQICSKTPRICHSGAIPIRLPGRSGGIAMGIGNAILTDTLILPKYNDGNEYFEPNQATGGVGVANANSTWFSMSLTVTALQPFRAIRMVSIKV